MKISVSRHLECNKSSLLLRSPVHLPRRSEQLLDYHRRNQMTRLEHRPQPSSSSSSSVESEDERTLSGSSPKGSPKLPPAASFFSDRMDICSMRSSELCLREKESFLRTASPMNVDTMIPAERVWCILHPLPGNAAGTTTLFLRKTTTTVGSDTRADLVLRHPKIADHHCTIVSGQWSKHRGLTGIIHIHDKAPVRFQHKSTIYILDDENGISSILE